VNKQPINRTILGAFLALLLGGAGHFHAAQSVDFAAKAIEGIAQTLNIPAEQLTVVNSAWLYERLYRAKVLDKSTGNIHVITLRTSGQLAAEDEVFGLIQSERERSFEWNMESGLKHRIESDPASTSTVSIWVKTLPTPSHRWRTLIESGQREVAFNEAREFHSKAAVPVLEFLGARSIKVKYASEYAPVIVAEIPHARMREIAELPFVARVFEDAIAEPGLATSIPAIRAQQVWSAGTTGSGVKVAVVEAPDSNTGTTAVSNLNPYLIPAN
jgi:hypothetical protein